MLKPEQVEQLPQYGFFREDPEEIAKAQHNLPTVAELKMIIYKTYIDAE